jgi:hypothetical protein
MAAPLLLRLVVYQSGTGLGMLLVVAVPLLLLLVYEPGTGLCVLLAVAVPLLLPLLVCQSGTGLYMLLAIAVPLLLPGCGGHASVVVLHLSSTLRLLEGLQIIMVLKQNTWQITFLHVYHCSSIALIWWIIAYHGPGGEGMPDCSFLTFVSDSTHELVALKRSKSIGVLSPIHHDGLECKRLVLEIL